MPVVSEFFGLIRRATSSARTHAAVTSTALSSLSNVLLSVAIARAASVAEMAQFAIAFAVYMLISGISRSMVAEPLAARLVPYSTLQVGGYRVSLISLVISGLTLVVGFALQDPFLVIIGLAGHGLAIGDFVKFASITFGRPLNATAQESCRLLSIVLLWSIEFLRTDALWFFTAWALSTAVIAYIAACRQKIPVTPFLRKLPVDWKESGSYGLEYFLGTGTSQVITFVVGGISAPYIVAALRGAGTLLGPVTVLATSVRSLIIPFISRGMRRDTSLFRSISVSVALAAMVVPLLVGVNLIPSNLGTALLGDTWAVASPVLALLSVEVFLSLQSHVPFAGHRSLLAHRRTLAIRSFLAPARVVLAGAGALLFGAYGAAIGLVLGSLISTVIWWFSYVNLVRHSRGEALAAQ